MYHEQVSQATQRFLENSDRMIAAMRYCHVSSLVPVIRNSILVESFFRGT